ncbi:tetraacyldisaccharide 4'-kinase [Flavobacterium sp. NRK1]|uniref:tetraacyldisaccharide 4'-kinase n=1 Tax=Flavobacterium sp. NRK1 TaxID=2954929 RepID=UPI0020937200|nr:tetraacyldisaccharide 4'-kinase [Flavobacterium sp. NRK1]MCO6146806.1 tetraacyldisaccharide 4'-kinase [Flavobacterium sp. NRK1]
MKFLRKLLLPFSLIYLIITAVRNFLYNIGFFKSFVYSQPVIAIGNLSTGGTGKTPQTEYLIRLLSDKYRVATLSRGYKRKSKGYVLGSTSSSAAMLGDEPFQFYKKFPNIRVAVDADRKNGIDQLLLLSPKPQVILLDDAYQHRSVKAGFYILLTSYGDIYPDDFLLPAGNLRESRSGATRAKIIIVTKCPIALSKKQQQDIIKKIKPLPYQKIFFTSIEYDDEVYSEIGRRNVNDVKYMNKALVAGIAKPEPFFNYLHQPEDEVLAYPDHHDFTESELVYLEELSRKKIIITTEKDYMRLRGKLPKDKLFYLPIKSRFLSDSDDFDKTILEYVGKSTGNS